MSKQIAIYEEIAGLSACMVDAARENDWENLIELEQRVAALRNALARTTDSMPDTAQAERKRALIQRILDDDAEVRRHTEPWMEHVRKYLGAGAQRRRVESAYGASR